VRPLEEQERRLAGAHDLGELLLRRRAPLAPQPQGAAQDLAERLHHERADAVGEARQRQAELEERVREVEIVDVAERLADVDDGAALGGAADALGALRGERDLAKEAAEEPTHHGPRPLEHRRRMRLGGAAPLERLLPRDHGAAFYHARAVLVFAAAWANGGGVSLRLL
jgi:hypothetical protein